MPTTTGPWLTPATVSTTTTPDPAVVITRTQTGPSGVPPETFATVCEKTTGAGVAGDPATQTVVTAGTASPREFDVAQENLQMSWPAVSGGMNLFYTGTVPPTAVGIEYQHPDGSASAIPDNNDPTTLVSATITFGLTANRSAFLPPTHPTVMTPEIRYIADPTLATVPGATLAGLALIGSTSAPSSFDAAVTVSGTLTTAPIQPPGGIHGTYWWNLVLHHHEAITHAAPTTGTAGAGDESWGSTISPPLTLSIAMTYQPPRYRFLYSTLPRLRQSPRDDFLGGAPRQGHSSTSVQASTRQGWRGTYR